MGRAKFTLHSHKSSQWIKSYKSHVVQASATNLPPLAMATLRRFFPPFHIERERAIHPNEALYASDPEAIELELGLSCE